MQVSGVGRLVTCRDPAGQKGQLVESMPGAPASKACRPAAAHWLRMVSQVKPGPQGRDAWQFFRLAAFGAWHLRV